MHLPLRGVTSELFSISRQGAGDGRRQGCSDFELNHAECLEAYGIIQGYVKCAKFKEDLSECIYHKLKLGRIRMMQKEKYKKMAKGEIKWSERWGKPIRYDSFIDGVFYP